MLLVNTAMRLKRKMSNLTYEEIDRLAELLEEDKLHDEYTNKDLMNDLVRLLVQTLRNNRYLADMIQKSATESRMAFGIASKILEQNEKILGNSKRIEGNISFLLGNKNETLTQDKGVPIARRTTD